MKSITVTIAIALLTIWGTEAVATATATNPLSDTVIIQNDDCKGDKDDC